MPSFKKKSFFSRNIAQDHKTVRTDYECWKTQAHYRHFVTFERTKQYRLSRLARGKLYEDLDAAAYWKTKILYDFLKDRDPSQIFKAYKVELFYRAFPEHIHMLKTKYMEICKGIK